MNVLIPTYKPPASECGQELFSLSFVGLIRKILKVRLAVDLKTKIAAFGDFLSALPGEDEGGLAVIKSAFLLVEKAAKIIGFT